MDDAARERWRATKADYECARKLAAACLGADAGDDVVESATRTLLEHYRAIGAPPGMVAAPKEEPAVSAAPACPKCGGVTLPVTKKNPRQPDFRCPDAACDAGVWTGRKGKTA